MKAVQIHEFGDPDVLKFENAKQPQVKPDEILVKIIATSVNPVDWKVRQGKMAQINYNFPLILGWDFSGIVADIGNDVKNFMLGTEVWGLPDITKNGTYAEYIAVKASQVAEKPTKVSHLDAATIPLAGTTAWQGIFDHGKLKAGQKILIHGAAGGVGTLAVQLAKWKGAFVIGTASADNISFLMDLGVDEVIDYHAQQFEKELEDIDLVFDTIGGETQKKSAEVLKPGGILISTVALEYEAVFKEKNLMAMRFMAQANPDQLDKMAELMDSGKLKAIVQQTFALKDMKEAHELSEKGHVRGKLAIEI